MRTRSGFTLLEILVVLAILGMGLALITAMTTHSARYSERVAEETTVQLACENMMNSILSGTSVAALGVEIPIPDAPNWSVTVEALDGPIDKIIAIRITAQRYQTFETVSPNNIQSLVVARTPEPGRRIVLKEWARRADVRTRVVKVDANGKTTAVDGTGETLAHDLSAEPSLGGGLDSAPGSAFDVDAQEQASGAAFDAVDAALAPSGAPTVGGGLSGF